MCPWTGRDREPSVPAAGVPEPEPDAEARPGDGCGSGKVIGESWPWACTEDRLAGEVPSAELEMFGSISARVFAPGCANARRERARWFPAAGC